MKIPAVGFAIMALGVISLMRAASGRADQLDAMKQSSGHVHDPARISIEVKQGLLSVSLREADLFEVMDALARESGVRVKVDKEARKKISLSFKDMPFEKGIKNIIRPLNHAMVWKTAHDASGQEEKTLVELHVFREGHQGSEAVVFTPSTSAPEGGEPEESKVHKRVWSEETRRRMLEKLQVKPSEP